MCVPHVPHRPTLTDDNVLCIKGGRHPLAELIVSDSPQSTGSSAYIPNDTNMGADKGRVHVVTGEPCFVGTHV